MRDPSVTTKREYQIVVIPSDFEKAATDIQIVFNAAGQIAVQRPPGGADGVHGRIVCFTRDDLLRASLWEAPVLGKWGRPFFGRSADTERNGRK